MLNRSILNLGVRIGIALALQAAVIASPIRMSDSAARYSPSEFSTQFRHPPCLSESRVVSLGQFASGTGQGRPLRGRRRVERGDRAGQLLDRTAHVPLHPNAPVRGHDQAHFLLLIHFAVEPAPLTGAPGPAACAPRLSDFPPASSGTSVGFLRVRFIGDRIALACTFVSDSPSSPDSRARPVGK